MKQTMTCSILIFLLALAPGVLHAQPPVESHKLRAAIFLRFRNFIDFPDPAGRENSLCVLGRDPFRGALTKLEEAEKLKGGTVSVDYIEEIEVGCGLVYIPATERAELKHHLSMAEEMSVVTVSNMDGFIDSGGIIELGEAGDRISFSINLRVARECNIEISSRLLKLATKVKR